MSRPKVALATCKKLPEPDVDEELLVRALETAGARVRMLAWDDETAAADRDELVVIRSTWNYFADVDGFLRWTERTSERTRLLNPDSIVRANAKKTYLADLERRGIAVVPTEYVERSRRIRVEDVLQRRGWDAVVIKPVVSAGSFMTRRFEASDVDGAQRFLDELVAERDAMIQRWMPSVDTYGERSLVWIDGEVTHAIRKAPRFAGGQESVSEGEVEIAPDESAFAQRVLAPLEEKLLYARVDMVRDGDGAPRLMELELIEPSLFLKQCPRALDRFAAAIVQRAAAGSA
jgi:glutathione synthase/RimK-type ligase-like ATP-grasp enzyme